MLAKIWKKLLLAICIIAILFNITAKLVNRISLEKAISSTPDGVNMREVLNITDEQRTVTSDKPTSSVSNYRTIEEIEAEKSAQEAAEQEVLEQETTEQEVVEETTDESEEKATGDKIIDKVTDSITDIKGFTNLLY